MRKLLLVLLLGIGISFAAEKLPIARDSQLYSRILTLDDFSDGDISADPEWWTFDKLKISQDSDGDFENFIRLTGQTEDYYIGGMGTYFGRGADQYDAMVLYIKGNGEPAVLRVQLFDDDNGTYQLEQNEAFEPTHDDQWEHEIFVDWEGWRKVEIPFSRFVLANPGVGDGVWNPEATRGSGGLLHIQIIALLEKAVGKLNIGICSISFVKELG